MKIMFLESRSTNVEDTALTFETDEQVVSAWDWLVANKWLIDFSYRPEAEGEDPDRSFIRQYLDDVRAGVERRPLKADLIRRLMPSIHGAELRHTVVELRDPSQPEAAGA